MDKRVFGIMSINLFLIVLTLIFTVPPVLMKSRTVNAYVAETISQSEGCIKNSPFMALASLFTPSQAMASGDGGGGDESSTCCQGAFRGSICMNSGCDFSQATSYACGTACFSKPGLKLKPNQKPCTACL